MGTGIPSVTLIDFRDTLNIFLWQLNHSWMVSTWLSSTLNRSHPQIWGNLTLTHTHSHKPRSVVRIQSVGDHCVVWGDLTREDAKKQSGLSLLCVKDGLTNHRAALLLYFCNSPFLTSGQWPEVHFILEFYELFVNVLCKLDTGLKHGIHSLLQKLFSVA